MPIKRKLAQQQSACIRDLTRLRSLEERHRFRARMTRATRGGVGFVAGLGAAIKTKVAATIGGKLVVAALIALGLAWPMAVLWLVGFFVFAAVVAAIFGGEVDYDIGWLYFDCADCADCARKNKRRQRLLELIAEREQWLEQNPAI
jgi:hypothetical protein